MKLKLKHLAPYLPYGLKGYFYDKFDIVTEIDACYNIISSLNNGNILIKGFKPILRPLSDLTKEIEVNGERFIPIMNLCDLERKSVYWSSDGRKRLVKCEIFEQQVVKHDGYDTFWAFGFHQDGFFYGYETDLKDDDNSGMMNITKQFELFQKLFEWHFDVFGLIDAGLAIDINTI